MRRVHGDHGIPPPSAVGRGRLSGCRYKYNYIVLRSDGAVQTEILDLDVQLHVALLFGQGGMSPLPRLRLMRQKRAGLWT